MTTQTVSPPELNTLKIEIDGQIGTLTLDRPDAFNAMSPEMIGELTVAFAWLADQAPLRALIITGAGQSLLRGRRRQLVQDRGRRRRHRPAIGGPARRRGAAQAIVDLRRIPYPVIAAVNGPAAGAGFSLALACDIRIASEAAFFACAYGRIGASPDGGMTYFLPRVVGPEPSARAAARRSQHERPGRAGRAARGRGRRRRRADGRCPRKGREAGREGPLLRADSKRLCGQSIENSLTEHLQLERHGIADSMATEDLRAGVTAFFGGEKPEFKGV